MWKSIRNLFRTYFIAGLLVLVPLCVTAWVVVWIVNATDNLLATSHWLPFNIPGIGFLAAIFIILAAGFIGRNIFGQLLFRSAGELVSKLPVVGGIYSSIKQMLETILGSSQKKFGRVVLVEFPSPGSLTLAFVTADSPPVKVKSHLGEDYLCVYVPTTPNPISGFLIYLPISRVKNIDLSVDEAFKHIVSLGTVVPHGR